MIIYAFSLSNIVSIVVFAIMICFLIAWHELGHLFTAKKCNVYCYEYSIGFGPVLYRNKKNETHFVLRAIPLGGFVKMAGEEGEIDGKPILGNDGNPIPKDRIFANVAPGKRFVILAAGGIMNIIFAIVAFYFYISFSPIGNYFNGVSANATGVIMPSSTNEVCIITDSLLDNQGMESGDKIIKIDTKLAEESEYVSYDIAKSTDITSALSAKAPTKEGQKQDIIITYLDASNNYNEVVTENLIREGITRTSEDGTKSFGLTTLGVSLYKIYEYTPVTALYGVFEFTGIYAVEIIKAFGGLFVGNFENMSGLVGIYETVDTVTSATEIDFAAKFLNLIYLAGAISFSLGFFNLIPFPALDGGRLVFVLIEWIGKKKVDPKLEATIHFAGIVVLFALMIIINIRDIIGLF